jgi:hypothetical protein
VPTHDELLAQRRVVIDFPVEYDPDRPVFVADRLMPGRQVDDAQPPHTQTYRSVYVDALVIWSAMRNDLAHAPQHCSICVFVTPEFQNPGYSAHMKLIA